MNKDQDYELETRRTYDRIAADYCRTTPAPGVRETIIRSANRFIELLPRSGDILVLGSGDGRDAELFIRWKHSATLLDYSTAMTNLARERLGSGRIVQGDFRWVPFRRDVFAGVWASGCLYHVRKSSLPGVIASIRRILHFSGVLYLNLRRGFGERLDPRPRSYPYGGPRFYGFYTDDEVMDLMAGFEIVEQRHVDPVLGEDYIQLWARKVKE